MEVIYRKNFNSEPTEISAGNYRLKISAISLVGAGLLLILWASLGDTFKNNENVLTGKFCFPVSVGAALILFGTLFRTRLKNFGFWVSLGLIGQAASLQLIDAGRLIHFQHHLPLSKITKFEILPLSVLLLQIIVVFFAARNFSKDLREWLKKNFKIRRLVFAGFFLILSGAAITPDFSIYATDLIFAAVIQIVSLLNIVLAVRAFPSELLTGIQKRLADFFSKPKTFLPFDVFAVAATLWTTTVSAALCVFVYQNHPHVPDEVQYLFQANYFAAGKLTVKALAVPEAFSMYMIPWRESEWFSIFPPGWAALLAAGVKLGAVWLVNPLLAGLSVSLTFWILRKVYSVSFARFGTLLLCCSPWFLFMAMSFMSHIAVLALALAAIALLIKFQTKKRKTYLAVAGMIVGLTSLIRPLDAAILGALCGIWLMAEFSGLKIKLLNLFVFSAGMMLAGALIFPYNRAVTGDALLSPMDFYYTNYFWAGANSYGFGANRGMHWELDALPGHSPFESLINAALDVYLVNTELFGWATGSLILISVVFCAEGFTKKDRWLIAMIAAIAGGYGFYWYHGGPDFGARYWFLMIVPLVVLTLRGAQILSEKISAGNSEFNSRIVLVIILLCALSLVNYFPWRAADKYFRYLGMQPGIERLARANNFGKSLVIIRGANHPDYQSAWIYSSFDPEESAPIYAFDVSPEVYQRLTQTYSDRPIWVVNGPTLTGDGSYQVSAAPLQGGQMR